MRQVIRFSTAIRFGVLAMFLCAAMAWSQGADSFAGKWKMVSTASDSHDIAWTLNVTETHGKYSATAASDEGEIVVKDMKVDGENIHFQVTYQGEDYQIDLKRAGDALTGTWSGGNGSGETKGQRSSG